MTTSPARLWHLVTFLICAASLTAQFFLSLTGDYETAPVRVVNYFSFFTIESNLVVAAVTGTLTLRPRRDGRLWRVFRLDSVMAIAVTGLVYVTVLRGTDQLTGLAVWTNAGLHYVTPILVVLGWLFFGPRPRCNWMTLAYALVFPIAWVVYTLVRGADVHWYPYPFINVDTHGYGRVSVNCVIVAALIIGVTALFVVLDRKLPAAPGADRAVRTSR